MGQNSQRGPVKDYCKERKILDRPEKNRKRNPLAKQGQTGDETSRNKRRCWLPQELCTRERKNPKREAHSSTMRCWEKKTGHQGPGAV